jgi:uncharacterized protein YuzE
MELDVTFDATVDAAYIRLTDIAPGESWENLMIERGRKRWRFWQRLRAEGYVILDFSRDGVLLGVEVIGAQSLLPPGVVSDARRIDL